MSSHLLPLLTAGQGSTSSLNLIERTAGVVPGRENATWGAEFLSAMVWTGTAFVAVGRRGRAASSSDGVTWTYRPSLGNTFGMSTYILCLVWTGSRIIGYDYNYIYQSTDNGDTWSRSATNVPFSFTTRAWSVGSTVWVAGYSTLAHSSDGFTSWTDHTAGLVAAGWPADLAIDYLASSGSVVLVSSASGDDVARSTDNGATWTCYASPIDAGIGLAVSSLRGLVWSSAHSKFFALTLSSPDVLASSSDGITWTAYTSDVFSGSDSGRDMYLLGNNLLLTSAAGAVKQLDNAGSWTDGSSLLPVRQTLPVVTHAWSGSRLVTTSTSLASQGYGLDTQTTTDVGSTWSPVTSMTVASWPSGENLYSMVWTGSYYVLGGRNGLISTSPDGITWTYQPALRLSSYGTASVYALAYSAGTLIACVGVFNFALSTNNGLSWTYVTRSAAGLASFSGVPNGMTFHGGLFFTYGASKRLATSPDGATWTIRTLPAAWGSSDSVISLAYNGSVFVALGTNGLAATSTDGATWTDLPAVGVAAGSQKVTSIVRAGSQFVAVGNSSNVVTSTDGASWTSVGMVIPAWDGVYSFNALSYNGTFLIAASNNTGPGLIAVSSDQGATWQTRPTGSPLGFYQIVSNGSSFLSWTSASHGTAFELYQINLS